MDASIIDFTGGVQDVRERQLRIIGNPMIRYKEDPVRMLRAIRFGAKLHFQLAEETIAPLAQLNYLITHISGSRLFDEIIKLYQCGEGESVQRLLLEHGLFNYLFPQTASLMTSNYPINALLGIALENTDSRIRDNKPVTPAFLFAVLLWFPLKVQASKIQEEEELSPLTALEKSMSQVIMEQNKIITIPKRFAQVMREIWLLQFRFPKRLGARAFNLLRHPRFRAAYDFLAIRALAGDERMELANWWTQFQEVNEEEQHAMIRALSSPVLPSRPSKRKKIRKTNASQ